MTFSNQLSISRILLALPLVVTLAACDGRRESSSLEEATFRVDSVSLEKAAVQKQDAFGLPEVKTFQFQACLQDAVTRSSINLTDFAVSDGKSKKVVKTDGGGCMLWTETHKLSSLQKEKLLRIRRTFEGVQGFSGTVSVDLAFNPWTEDGTLYDLRKFTPADLEPTEESVAFESDLKTMGLGNPVGAAEAFMADVSLEFLGHDKSKTQITNLLTLKTAQKFRLRLQPQFIRRNLKNELVKLDLKGGEFHLKLIVLQEKSSDQTKPEDLVAEYQGNFVVQYDGTVTQDIVLRIHDTAALLSRNRVVVVLQPAGAAEGVALPGVYQGFVSPLRGNSTDIRLVKTQQDASSVLAGLNGALSAVTASPRAVDVLATYGGLKKDDSLLSLNAKSRPNGAYCDKLFTADQTVELEDWLGFKYKENLLKSCKSNPSKYIKITVRDLVESINGQPRNLPNSISTKTISISRSLNYSKSTTTQFGSDYALRAGLGLDLGKSWDLLGSGSEDPLNGLLGFSMKLGASADWYVSYGYNQSSSQSAGASVSEEQSLSVVSDGYEVDASVRSCVILSAPLGKNAGYYACSENVSQKTIREVYYLVNHGVSSSPFTDEESANNSRWRMTIRGEKTYKAFENLMTKSNGLLQFELIEDTSMSRPMLPDLKVTQEFPGVVSQ